jgi:hypothetical protein
MGEMEEFEPIPAGTYPADLSAWEYFEESKSSSEPYIKMEFTLNAGDFEGRKFWRNFSCQPKALRYLKKALVSLGAEDGDISGEWDTEDVLPDLIGNSCLLVIGESTYEGEVTNEVKRILSERVAV